jgi:hypothetical protein
VPYATVDDLTDWLDPDPVPANAEKLLARATRYLDNVLLKTSVYDVDEDGLPTEEKVITALRDATCAQVEWWAAHSDDGLGAGADYTTVTAGNISLSKQAAPGGRPPDPRQSPEAWEILSGAALTGHSPRTGC